MKKDKITTDLMNKIQGRTEFKIRMDTVEIWEAAIKNPEDFEMLLLAIVRYCKDFSEPDFSKAKDQRLLKRLFDQEAAKQKNAAMKYAEICMKRSEAGKKGRRASVKQTQANANKSQQMTADNDNDIDHDLDIDTEGIGIDIEKGYGFDLPIGPAVTGGPPADKDERKYIEVPEGFWDEIEDG